jgi:hypothetical protein
VRQILTADNLISEVPVHLQWDKLPTGLNWQQTVTCLL